MWQKDEQMNNEQTSEQNEKTGDWPLYAADLIECTYNCDCARFENPASCFTLLFVYLRAPVIGTI